MDFFFQFKNVFNLTKNIVYYNLDSKLEKAEKIGTQEQLVAYLENLTKSKDKELFLIVPKDVELYGTWKND